MHARPKRAWQLVMRSRTKLSYAIGRRRREHLPPYLEPWPTRCNVADRPQRLQTCPSKANLGGHVRTVQNLKPSCLRQTFGGRAAKYRNASQDTHACMNICMAKHLQVSKKDASYCGSKTQPWHPPDCAVKAPQHAHRSPQGRAQLCRRCGSNLL